MMTYSESSASIDTQFDTLRHHLNNGQQKSVHAVILNEAECQTLKSCIKNLKENLDELFYGIGDGGSENSGNEFEVPGRDLEDQADF